MEVSGSVLQELLSRMTLLCDHLAGADNGKATVPYTLPQLLEIAVEHRASALNINVGAPPALRINHLLSLVEGAPLTNADCRKLLAPVLNADLKAQLYKTGQAQTCISSSGAGFKVYLFLERGHVCASFRRLRTDIPKLETLGLNGNLVEGILNQPMGLILLTGLPRSGKINTLASLISRINTTRLSRIITLERPIQFWHYSQSSAVLQREVGVDVPGFAAGIEQALNQDTDVLALSEIPDRETAAFAIRAATSHKLVLAVLDATSSVRGVERIIGAFDDDDNRKMLPIFANSLRLVLHQTLVNRSDGRGVIPAFEILVNNDQVHNEIQNGKVDKLAWIMQEQNMQTLGRSLGKLVASGLVTEEEALRYVSNPNELQYDKEALEASAYTDNATPVVEDNTDTPLMSWL